MQATVEDEFDGESRHSGLSPASPQWQKAQACQATNGCVELAPLSSGIAGARDSVLGDASPILFLDQKTFRDFLSHTKQGVYDLP
ncbi:DUF397 domain-containing protein [Actinomadura sp. 6N118]|uniref:DUF397 domain-containing protein n=1 Tax=Actinomadura sp. 6N118 TaxID=3375151 RepID=UPI0037939196